MKTANTIFKKMFIIFIIAASPFHLIYAQNLNANKNKSSVKDLIAAQTYVFKAQTVLPAGGNIRQLNTDYDMRVSKDTVRTYLPYFGRAYSAPINPSEGGIQFTSTSFNYSVKSRKKGGWDIIIQPKDTKDVRQLLLTVFDNGQASLQVSSDARQSISYNGFVTAKR